MARGELRMKSKTPGSAIARAVEDEFGQPFWEVVRGFAADGESMGTKAMRQLGIVRGREYGTR
jgi:hypothetical protein